jgi:hypothetical protein
MINRRRVFLIVDIDGQDLEELEKSDIAGWIDAQLHGNERGTFKPVTVYDSLDDMVSDRDEGAGDFAPGS